MNVTLNPTKPVTPITLAPIAYVKTDIVRVDSALVVDRIWVEDDLEGFNTLMPVSSSDSLALADSEKELAPYRADYFSWCDGLGMMLAQA